MKKYLIILFLLISCNAWGASVTVCDSGCDYTTVALALAGVGNGNHTITVTGTYTAAENINITNSGTDASNRLTITADNYQTVKRFLINGSYLTISGFTFNGLTGNDCMIQLSDNAGSGISYVTVSDSIFDNTAQGVKSAAIFSSQTTANIVYDSFAYVIGGTAYTKTTGNVAPGNDVIPQGKYGAVALDIGVDGTMDVIEATNNSTGYDSTALAIAGLPAKAADHVRAGYLTVTKSDGDFTFGTSEFDAENVTYARTNTFDYPSPICSKNNPGGQSSPIPDHIIISGNEIVRASYLSMLAGTNYTFSNNTVHDNLGGQDATWVCGDGITVSGNEFYNINELGDNHTDIVQVSNACGGAHSKNVTWERNYHHDCVAQWANLSHDGDADITNWTFRNNIFENFSYSGNIGITNVTIANNTFYKMATDLSWTITGMDNVPCSCDNIIIRNNVFINKTASNIGWYLVSSCVDAVTDHNYVADEDDYGAKTGFSETHGVNGGDPKLLNIAAGTAAGFALTSASTILINAADDLSASFTNDYSGNTRSSWDIGAYEYQSGATTPSHSFSGGATHSFTGGSTITWQ